MSACGLGSSEWHARLLRGAPESSSPRASSSRGPRRPPSFPSPGAMPVKPSGLCARRGASVALGAREVALGAPRSTGHGRACVAADRDIGEPAHAGELGFAVERGWREPRRATLSSGRYARRHESATLGHLAGRSAAALAAAAAEAFCGQGRTGARTVPALEPRWGAAASSLECWLGRVCPQRPGKCVTRSRPCGAARGFRWGL